VIGLAAVQAVRGVVGTLVGGSPDELDRLIEGGRLTASDIYRSIEEHGGAVVVPPEEAFSSLDAVEVDGSGGLEYAVDLPIYTAEEGRTDLVLDLRVWSDGDGLWDVEVHDLHVA